MSKRRLTPKAYHLSLGSGRRVSAVAVDADDRKAPENVATGTHYPRKVALIDLVAKFVTLGEMIRRQCDFDCDLPLRDQGWRRRLLLLRRTQPAAGRFDEFAVVR
jgi:hypothetical protein